MKILFLARSLEIGGAERQLLVLTQELVRRGHNVSIALLYSGGAMATELEGSGIAVHHLKKRGRWDVAGPLLALLRLLGHIKPQVLHGYLPIANVLAAIAGMFAPGCKVVFGIRASDMDLSRYPGVNHLLYGAEAWLARRTALVISNSAAGLRAFWRRGAPSGRGIVIPNGIDTGRFRPDAQARQDWRKRLGIGDGCRLIGMIARSDPMKGHDTALAAASRMGPEFSWVMAGSGVTDLDQTADVHLLESLPDVEQLMAALDVGVLSSRFGEGFPNVLAEMMACGVPCVTTDVGDAADIIGEMGAVVPRGDAAGMARSCADLAARVSPGLSQKCRQAVETRFSVTQLAERTEKALDTLELPLILHIITGLETGGAELMLARLARGSRAFRHTVISLTGEGALAASLRADGIEVIPLGLRPGIAAFVGLPRLIGLIRRLRPVLVQTWLYHSDLLGTVATRLAGRIPLAWSMRCSDMDEKRYGWLVTLLARLSFIPDAVVANSWAGRDWHTVKGYHPHAWDVIANGIDCDHFQPDAEARARWRTKLGIPNDRVLVGMAARVDPMKDYETFMAVAERMPHLTFVAAGRGTENLPNAPILRLGEVADMAGFYATLDVAVQVSRFGEGFPNAVAEAMACGLPVVAADCGDASKIIGDVGITIPVGDVDALEKALSDMTAPRRLALGEAARRRVMDHYGMASAISAFEALWRRLATAED